MLRFVFSKRREEAEGGESEGWEYLWALVVLQNEIIIENKKSNN